MFKGLFSNVSSSISRIPSVQVEIVDDTGAVCKECSTFVTLQRDGKYFKTALPIVIDINLGKTYTIYIKGKTTVRRSFSQVTFIQNQVLDCTATNPSGNCGEFKTKIDAKSFISGDTDGTNKDSDSYSKIDSIDLQVMSIKYGTNAIEADFNLDGTVDILDLDIMGKNYGLHGE